MNRLLTGAITVLAATLPMTVMMTLTRPWIPQPERYFSLPRIITMRVARRLGLKRKMSEPQRLSASLAAHFAYGAAAGALYSITAQNAPLPPVLKGIGYGLGLWGAGYMGWLPATGLLKPATQHSGGRNASLIASHLVWGAVMGSLSSRIGQQADRDGNVKRRRIFMGNKKQTGTSAKKAAENRESGAPGGGAGRRDETGRTPVFPVSASEGAKPEARVQSERAFGQGERGAAGYQDAGSSEISNFGQGIVAGGADTNSGGQGSINETRTVGRAEWLGFFDNFSRQYAGVPTTVEILGERPSQALRAVTLPFAGITADLKDGEDLISVILGDRPQDHFTHNVNAPSRVTFSPQNGVLEIEASDGMTTRLRLGAAA